MMDSRAEDESLNFVSPLSTNLDTGSSITTIMGGDNKELIVRPTKTSILSDDDNIATEGGTLGE